MQYNVSQLLKSSTGAMRDYDLHQDIAQIDPEIRPLTTLDGNIQMIRTTDGIFVRGNLNVSAELTCARCLDEFSMPLRIALEEEFHSTIDMATGAELPQIETETATLIDDHHALDLTEVVRQGILLALPPFPICRSACAGLCPTCGKNRNYESCDHAHDAIDPRLEKLKELMNE
ncbi:MAG: DUF177 domain-containing protein [Chloroflexi bacterium]|nr:DUF177 domain-containing protein [Chloroflexota bacterium]